MVLSPGQSTERCLHDYLRPATRTLVSDRVGHKDLAGDAAYLAQEAASEIDRPQSLVNDHNRCRLVQRRGPNGTAV